MRACILRTGRSAEGRAGRSSRPLVMRSDALLRASTLPAACARVGGRIRRRTNHEIIRVLHGADPACLVKPHQAREVPGAGRQNGAMVIVRATKKLLDRLGPPTSAVEQASSTLLGDWYATAWFWRPQVALLVSEVTLLPVLVPLAPAATLLQRLGSQLAAVL